MAIYGGSTGWSRGAWGSGPFGMPTAVGGYGTADPPAVDKQKLLAQRRAQGILLDDEEVAALIVLNIVRGTTYDPGY